MSEAYSLVFEQEDYIRRHLPGIEDILRDPKERVVFARFAPDIFYSQPVQRRLKDILTRQKARAELNGWLMARLTPECREEWRLHINKEQILGFERWRALIEFATGPYAIPKGLAERFPNLPLVKWIALLLDEEKSNILEAHKIGLSIPAKHLVLLTALERIHGTTDEAADRLLGLHAHGLISTNSSLLKQRERAELLLAVEEDFRAQRELEKRPVNEKISGVLSLVRFALYIQNPWGVSAVEQTRELKEFEEPLLQGNGTISNSIEEMLPTLRRRIEEHIVITTLERLFGSENEIQDKEVL